MSDDEDEPRMIHDQHYDESMDVADGEDVTSVYTPQTSSRRPAGQGSPRGGLKRAKILSIPGFFSLLDIVNNVTHGSTSNFLAPDTTMPTGGMRVPHGQQAHHLQNDSPDDSPRSGENDETQGDSESDPDSSQALHGGGGGQKEYKAPDPNAYDPKMYRDLPVSAEIKDLFKYIEKYQPQDIILETKLKPFIPEFVPAIGDIDAFLKVPRPDGKEDLLGLTVLDEPSSRQSDPHVLGLQMRYTSKQPMGTSVPSNVRSVTNADKNPKAIEEWVHNISKLQKSKTVDTVQYRKPMPDVDNLMQEWPTQFEELLKEVSVPPADIDTDLSTYTDIACSLLDIPVYESRIQSLHALFTLYLGFKNSEHFKAMMNVSDLPIRRDGNNHEADQMFID
ncbi:unnamed protein product [Adineta steineri]|uniref:Intraflagellar transport protein 46 homolog n=1 Tax=Adineta steineri TaxID=433720 RepID=A0A813TI07_9BILA|nr:unnamed protein product [Adineta steineri]CAF3488710.1 unnamed protein product [Adineta steineri]